MIRTIAAGIFAVVVGIPAARAGADPALLSLAPANSKVLVGVQVNQVKAAPFGQYLVSQIQLDAKAEKALEALGFDPRRDLTELLVASDGVSSGLLMGRGSFHPEKLSASASAAGLVGATYRGVQVLDSKSPGGTPSGSIAFLDKSTVISGDSVAVRAAIDRHAAAEAFSGTLAARARQISSANDVWIASLQAPAEALAGLANNSQIKPLANVLQSALQLSAGLRFTASDVTLSAEILTKSADDAQQMAALLRLLASLAQSSSSHGSDGAGSGRGGLGAGAAQITTSGPVAILTVSVPEKQLEQLFTPPAQPKRLASLH